MYKCLYGLISIYVLSALAGTAQEVAIDSANLLEEVVIDDQRLYAPDFATATAVLDSADLARYQVSGNLAEALAGSGLVHYRNYGSSNSLSLPALRGSGSAHTVLLWEGIPIQSPLTGQTAVNQVSTLAGSSIEVTFAPDVVQSGSGALGGTIALREQRPDLGFHSQLQAGVGTFATHTITYRGSHRTERWYAVARVGRTQSDNDFTYIDGQGQEKRRIWNKSLQQTYYGQLHYRLHKGWHIDSKAWIQKDSVQLPGSTFAAQPPQETQADWADRFLLTVSQHTDTHQFYGKVGYFNQRMFYRNPSLNNLVSRNDVQTFFTRWGYIRQLPFGQLDIETNWQRELTRVSNFDGRPDRTTMMGKAVWTAPLRKQKIHMRLGLRTEYLPSYTQGLAYETGLEYYPTTSTTLFAKYSRGYRIPTLNDLFWNGVGARGNPDLQAEQSQNVDVGLTYTSGALSVSGSAFYSDITDWIVWLPAELGQFTPLNRKKGSLRGARCMGSYTLSGQVNLRTTWNYSYTLSHDEETNTLALYSPKHLSGLQEQVIYKGWQVGFQLHYRSKQFTELENMERFSLPDQLVASSYLEKRLTLLQASMHIKLLINNAFNTTYEGRRGYPAPGRAYFFSISTHI